MRRAPLHVKTLAWVPSEGECPRILKHFSHNKCLNSGLGETVIINHKKTFWHKYATKRNAPSLQTGLLRPSVLS